MPVTNRKRNSHGAVPKTRDLVCVFWRTSNSRLDHIQRRPNENWFEYEASRKHKQCTQAINYIKRHVSGVAATLQVHYRPRIVPASDSRAARLNPVEENIFAGIELGELKLGSLCTTKRWFWRQQPSLRQGGSLTDSF